MTGAEMVIGNTSCFYCAQNDTYEVLTNALETTDWKLQYVPLQNVWQINAIMLNGQNLTQPLELHVGSIDVPLIDGSVVMTVGSPRNSTFTFEIATNAQINKAMMEMNS